MSGRISGFILAKPFSRKDGTWIGKYRREEERAWHQVRLPRAKDERTAESELAAAVAELALDEQRKAPRPETFGVFVRRRLGELLVTRARKYRQYEIRWRVYLEGRLGKCTWEELTTERMQALIAWLQTRTLPRKTERISPAYINAVYSTLSWALADAEALGFIPKNPATLARRFLPKPSPTRSKTKRKGWGTTEVATLLNYRFKRLRGLFATEYAFTFFCCRRVGETRGTRWSALQLDAPGGIPFVRIVEQFDAEAGDTIALGRDAPTRDLRGTKTGNVLEIPIHPQLEVMLRAWRDEGFRNVFGRAPAPDDFLFPHSEIYGRHDGKSQQAIGDAAKALARHAKQCGLDPIDYHGLRHSAATAYVSAGVPESFVWLRILGHSPRSISERYVQVAMIDLARHMSKLRLPLAAAKMRHVEPCLREELDRDRPSSATSPFSMPNPLRDAEDGAQSSVIHAVSTESLSTPRNLDGNRPAAVRTHGADPLTDSAVTRELADTDRPVTAEKPEPLADRLAKWMEHYHAAWQGKDHFPAPPDPELLVELLQATAAHDARATAGAALPYTIVVMPHEDGLPGIAHCESEEAGRAVLAWMVSSEVCSIQLLGPRGEHLGSATPIEAILDDTDDDDDDSERTPTELPS